MDRNNLLDALLDEYLYYTDPNDVPEGIRHWLELLVEISDGQSFSNELTIT